MIISVNLHTENLQGKHAISNWMLLMLLSILLPVTATAGRQKDTVKPINEYVMTVNRSAMAVVDSNVVVSLQMTAFQDVPPMQMVVLAPVLIDTVTLRNVEFPLVFLNSRGQQIYFERYLQKEYPDAIALRKKRGENLEIDYLRTTKYESWMDNAVLKLQKKSCACNNMKDRGEEIVACFEKEEIVPEIKLYPVYLIPPADNEVKVREERGSAFLCFEVNKWEIKPDYMNNPEELMKIHNSVNLVRNDSDVTIRKMTIEGYASPEGPDDRNLMLSEKRTEALRQYLEATRIAKNIRVEASGKGENWDGFLNCLKNKFEIPQREKLLSIAVSNLTNDEKETQMRRETPEGFSYVLRNEFPALRCTNYTVIYTVRPFTLEESERVFETRPINLNLSEIYKLADKYAQNEEKYYSIIRKAYMLYPNDSYINLTMAYLAIKKGDAEAAAEHLSKVNDCPEKTMDEGLVAYLTGDVDKAFKLVEQAMQMGVTQASTQMEEFKKLRKQ